MKEPTNKQKVEALEKIVRAIFGRYTGKIEYQHFGHKYMIPQIWIECDIEDAVNVKPLLSSHNIDMTFYAEGYMTKPWMNGLTKKKLVPEARVYAELYLNRRLFDEVEQLEQENKQLKKQMRKVNDT